MKFFVFILSFFAASVCYSGETVYFKIANLDDYINFFSYSEAIQHPFIKEIAHRTMKRNFSPDCVSAEYYQIAINRGLIWQGQGFTQYDYRSLKNDRFRRVVWVGELEQVLKFDIYDIEDKLLFSAFSFDDIRGKNIDKRGKDKLFEHSADDKGQGYFGFVNIFTEEHGGVVRMLFSDGLNAFSIFKFPLDLKNHPNKGFDRMDLDKTERLIVYGNYLYKVKTDKFRYMVVGSIPFKMMETIIEMIDSDNKDFEKLTKSAKSEMP